VTDLIFVSEKDVCGKKQYL